MKTKPSTKLYVVSPDLDTLALEITDEISFTKAHPHDLEAYQGTLSPYQIKLRNEAIKAELFRLIQELTKNLK